MSTVLCRRSLVLVPRDLSDVRRLVDYSLGLFSGAGAEYICGLNSYPHITIVQVETEPQYEDKLCKVFETLPPFAADITINEFYARPENESVLWTGLAIKPHPDLLQFQMAAAQAVRAAGFTVNNKSGVDYWPHITTARLHAPFRIDVTGLNCHGLSSAPIAMVAEHGVSGTRWRYEKQL